MSIRQELYLEILSHFNSFGWGNLFTPPIYRFHNILLEVFWRIGFLIVPFVCVFIYVIGIGIRFSISSFFVLFYVVCAMFSFELDAMLFLLYLCVSQQFQTCHEIQVCWRCSGKIQKLFKIESAILYCCNLNMGRKALCIALV